MIKRYNQNKTRRTIRTRSKVMSTGQKYRLSVNRSNKYIYAQLLDVFAGKTLVGTWGKAPEEVGKKIAEAAKKMKVEKVAFDRGAYKYHGRVKLLADAARAAGLKF